MNTKTNLQFYLYILSIILFFLGIASVFLGILGFDNIAVSIMWLLFFVGKYLSPVFFITLLVTFFLRGENKRLYFSSAIILNILFFLFSYYISQNLYSNFPPLV